MAAPRAYPVLNPEQIKRFWAKVQRGPAKQCWPWLASKKGRGYGALRVNGQALSAHRVAWELIHGPVAPRRVVYPTVCNEPACCNPAHLAVGSKSDAMLAASRHGTKLGRGVNALDLPEKDEDPRPIAKPYPKLTEKQLGNFWRKVDKRGPDECWEWVAASGGSGYGSLRVAGRNLTASRLSYFIEHGKLPLQSDVCHTCDNPPCVNPVHLFLGTRKINMEDCEEKGRGNAARGKWAGKTKLKPEQVHEIRRRGDTGESRVKLAAEFGVTPVSISNIVMRKTWKWLPERLLSSATDLL